MQSRTNAKYLRALSLEEKDQKDPAEITALLAEAANEGSHEAKYALATFYLHGKYVESDPETALRYLTEAAGQRNSSAIFDLAVLYETGKHLERNRAKAFDGYFLSMLLGDSSARYEVARCLYHGIGIKKNMRLYKLVRSFDQMET